ncbi:MAG: alpha/beta hydrolase [Chloroflexi bacterium]|nr:MAG: alpha/beta hydrolase [Chloroflexota bacterium]
MASNQATPDTIVLIHGLWLTPLSWEHWVDRYTKRGYNVIAPTWPGMEGGIEDLRRNPDKVAGLGVTEIVDHYDAIVRKLDRPPIIMGQAMQPTPEQFHYSFGNLLSEEESRAVYDRYAIPGPDHVLFQASLANFNPHAATAVNFHNDTRAPLLLIAGGKDHIVPASVTKANYNLYRKSKAVTDFKEYPDRSHYTVGQPGWEEVADYALTWAVDNASKFQKAPPVTAGAR